MNENFNYSNSESEGRIFLTDFLISLRNACNVLFIILAIIFVLLYSDSKISLPGISKEYYSAKEEAVWAHEAFSQWNLIYESGSFDELCNEVFSVENSDHCRENWEHYDFINYYRYYTMCLSQLEQYDTLQGFTLFDYIYLSSASRATYVRLTESDMEILSGLAADLGVLFEQRYDFTDDPNEVYIEVAPDGYVEYDRCKKYAESFNASISGNNN